MRASRYLLSIQGAVLACALAAPLSTALASWVTDPAASLRLSPCGAAPMITTDGAGGSIVVWLDDRRSYPDLRAQRLSAGGALLWEADGMLVGSDTHGAGWASVASDSEGGVVMAWTDAGVFQNALHLLRIDPAGHSRWQRDGSASDSLV